MLYFRTAFRAAVFVMVAICLWTGTVAALSPEPDHITLTWTGDPRTTQTVTWRTDATVNAGEIHYYEVANDNQLARQVRVAAARTKSLETPEGIMYLHSATLSGLAPGRTYGYQVGGGNVWSSFFTFTTEPLNGTGFKFLIFGDSQSLNYKVWRSVLQQAVRDNPDAVFFTNVGDLVDVGQDYAEWEAWFTGVEGVSERLPFMPVTGNHEMYTPERVFSRPEFFTAQFILPDNGPEGLKGQVYSFDYGDVHFIMLDSQAGEQLRFLPDMLERQRQWLAGDLSGTRKKWKIAFTHRPIYDNKAGGVNEGLRRAFGTMFDQYGVDVVFTAHDHVVARTYPLYDGERAVNPDRGTVYAATGRSGMKSYANASANRWDEFFYNPTEEPGYMVVVVSDEAVKVRTVDRGGRVIDEWLVVRP